MIEEKLDIIIKQVELNRQTIEKNQIQNNKMFHLILSKIEKNQEEIKLNRQAIEKNREEIKDIKSDIKCIKQDIRFFHQDSREFREKFKELEEEIIKSRFHWNAKVAATITAVSSIGSTIIIKTLDSFKL